MLNKATLLAAQSVAASLAASGVTDELLTFGSDDETRKRIEALPENFNPGAIFAAFDVPVSARAQILEIAQHDATLGGAAKSLEIIRAARKERDRQARFEREQAEMKQREADRSKARGEETSYAGIRLDLTSEQGVKNAIKSVLDALMGTSGSKLWN